jgi:hypothetical protein
LEKDAQEGRKGLWAGPQPVPFKGGSLSLRVLW